MAQRVGLTITLYPVKNWDESLAASQAGRCQIMSFEPKTPKRRVWLRFTEPIFDDPNILVTREHPFVGDLREVCPTKRWRCRAAPWWKNASAANSPTCVVLTESEDEAVALVSTRQADLTVRSLIVAAYAIKKEFVQPQNRRPSAPIYQPTAHRRAEDEPLLLSILDKGVMTIAPQEREAISNRHVAVTVQQGMDYRLVWKVAAGAALLLLLAFIWNRKLTRLNRELARLSVTDRLTGLYNRLKKLTSRWMPRFTARNAPASP